MKAYVNSRGDEEEQVMAIANYLNMEEHLTEAATKEPQRVKELTSLLDEVRENRQELVKLWSDGKANPNHWCSVKHAINSCYHLHELITNAARDNPGKVPELTDSLTQCFIVRDKAIDLFMSGDGGGEVCERCAADLSMTRTPQTAITEPVAGDSERDEEIKIWVSVFVMLVVVAVLAANKK